MSKNKCPKCGHNCEGDFCWKHQNRKPMPKIGAKKKLTKEIISEAMDNIFFMREFFLIIWKKRPHKSEISRLYLHSNLDGHPYTTCYFHHILEKEKYPEAKLDEENIILLTPEEHDNVEIDMYRYEEINKRREQLKIKYGL